MGSQFVQPVELVAERRGLDVLDARRVGGGGRRDFRPHAAAGDEVRRGGSFQPVSANGHEMTTTFAAARLRTSVGTRTDSGFGLLTCLGLRRSDFRFSMARLLFRS
jgi:hypothetical protein